MRDNTFGYHFHKWRKELVETCYLSMVEVHTVHGQLLGIFQEVNLCFSWCHPPDKRDQMRSTNLGVAKREVMLSHQFEYATH